MVQIVQRFYEAGLKGFILSLSALVFVCAGLGQAYGQNNRWADSLAVINLRPVQASEKLTSILELCVQIPQSEFRNKFYVAERGILLATGLKDSVKIAQFYDIKGSAFYFKGKFDSAAYYYYESIRILETQKDPVALANVLNNLARLYRKKREFSRAISAYDRSMGLFREANDSGGVAMIYNESGVVYEYMGDFDEAMRRYRASLNIQEIRNDQIGISYGLSNIGYLNISLKEYREAEKYLKQALKIRTALNDSFSMALNYTELGELYLKMERYNEATEYFRKSNEIASKLIYPDLQKENYRNLSALAEQSGNYKQALIYFKTHKALQDSMYRLESASRIEEISTQYETEKKASENELLKKTISLRDLEIKDESNRVRIRTLTLFSVIILFLLVLFIGLFVFYRIRREQQIKIQMEVNTAREIERRRISRDLHDNLGAQMSYMISVLEKASENDKKDTYVASLRETAGQAIMTLRETVWAINQREISVENFSDKFKQFAKRQIEHNPDIELSFKEDITENRILGPATALNLYRICQEAFSNAVKHSNAAHIWVEVKSNPEYALYFSVKDDGIGFDAQNGKKEGHYGLENMEFRAQESGAEFKIKSEPGRGTLIEVFSDLTKQITA